MIELTEEQRHELTRPGPVQARDPVTNELYVLVRAETYERMRALLGEESWAEGAYRAAMEVFGRDGWDDPRMDVYDALDLRDAGGKTTSSSRLLS
jgi:hypothetical protein